MVTSRDRWLVRLLALFCLATGLQILIQGELGAPTTDAVYAFDGLERLYALWPLFLAVFFYWISTLDGNEITAQQEKDKDPSDLK